MTETIIAYTDYKSPYPYLAKDPTYELAAECGVEIDWRPYTLDIPAYLGSAEVDGRKSVVSESRNAHQWRRVKYSYMDCRRQANKRGLTIRGTQKIFDSSIANIAMLFAKRHGAFRPYNDITFERFWKRELDIEDAGVVAGVLSEAGAPGMDFAEYLASDGPSEYQRIIDDAHEKGVFGVPSFLFEGELFWGREHLPDIRTRLGA